MPISPSKVFAIIVSHNGSTWICQAIKSLQQSICPVHIIVVDNVSTDETVEIVRSSYSDVMIFCMSSNLGFGAANNQGIRYAVSQGADYVFLLNQDARVAPETIGNLVDLMQEKPAFGILSPLQLDYHGSGIDRSFVPYLQENDLLLTDVFLGKLQGVYEVSFVNAAVWLVSRSVLESVGGFDPLFFMYGEDNDYCSRVRYRGFKIGIAPKTLAWHRCIGPPRPKPAFFALTNRFYIQTIHLLKRPDRFFLRNIPGLCITWLRMALHACIECDFKRACAVLISLLKTISMLGKIWTHYRVCKRSLRPWL
ncbi:MAG: glycosyltransferase family 2 protein [Pseudomonadota bacterium]